MMRLAWPALIEQLLNILVSLTDTYLTGNLLPNPAYLAAIGLMAYLMWMMFAAYAPISIGATALIARFVGAGDRSRAVRVLHQAYLVGAVFAAVSFVVLWLGGGWIVWGLQLRGTAADAATRYLTICAFVAPALMIEHIGISCLRGAGDTLSGFVIMSTVNVVNAVASYVLLQGWGPIPALGWDGLAYGTAIGHGIGACMVLALLIRGRAGLRLRWRRLRWDPSIRRRLFAVGIPGGLDMWSILACHFVFVGLVFRIGDIAQAAHGLAIRVEALAYLPGGAFAIAATTLAGQYLGAKDPAKATRSVLLALLVSGLLLTAMGAVFLFAPGALIDLFISEENVAAGALAARLLAVVSWAMPPLAVSMVLTGALRGAGDTRYPLVVTLVSFLCFRIPLTLVLAHNYFELPWIDTWLTTPEVRTIAAWWVMTSEVYIRAGLIAWRFLHGGWRQIDV
jgi:putative MATE family efflux protein